MIDYCQMKERTRSGQESMNPGHAGKDKEKNSYGTEKERQ